jgi:lipid A ethanolaminephosphotransferase
MQRMNAKTSSNGLPTQLPMQTDTLLALLCVYWALAANRGFLSGARNAMQANAWQLLGLVLLLALLHYAILAPVVVRAWAKPLLALLALAAGLASYFTQSLGAVLDPAMLRNALNTDWHETRELLTGSMALHLAVVVLPAWLLISRVVLLPARSLARALLGATARWLLVLLAFGSLLGVLYQPLSSLMRNHKALRYQIVPAAPLWSLPKSLMNQAQDAVRVVKPIGLDASAGPSWARAPRARLLVLVVGETVRAANWGERQLADGSRRDTTPLLRAEPNLLHWPTVHSCGTDTETSLPCMFAPVGRRDYNESRIRGEQSLLHVLARAGVHVHWIDNQSGCKGVCDGLPSTQLQCHGGRCLDDALLADLPQRLADAAKAGGTHLLVLHMLGTHGPAYHRRVPEGFGPYQPACQNDDLGRCSQQDIVNAFDNVLRHTDSLLAGLWQQLRAAQTQVDTALLFIPDHGESLGERGLYLHGIPYTFAPREQKEVPMLMGIAPAWAQARGWHPECLAKLPQQPAPSHDHLFHTLLTLLDVRTALYAPDWDLLRACEPP